MANPYQQQVFQRKLLYIGLIVVLFSGSWAWRRYVVDRQATQLSLSEESRGEVELKGAAARLALTGLNGVVTCYLWSTAMDKQKKNQWNELEEIVDWMTRLQPHFITPWLFQSWNLAYNVSVESDRVRDKYFYVSRGVELLGRGERQNRNHPDLRWSIGFYTMHKVCQSDETNVHRSLFQLSCMPPNERDPARFYTRTEDGGTTFNWKEFAVFCREHPQLVRRLRLGMHRDTPRAKEQQFTCPRPQDVVQFLEDNQQVPSLYKFTPPPGGLSAVVRVGGGAEWDRNKKDVLQEVGDRFPVLPPPHASPFDKEALTTESTLRDETDGFAAAHAWYCYAQEPIPEPGELPGSTSPVTDRTRQRRPRHMTTLIFRNYPAQGLRYMAERLQAEGWYDEEGWDLAEGSDRADPQREDGWDIRPHLRAIKDASAAEKEGRLGAGHKWSQDAWSKARDAWKTHGEQNHIFLDSAALEREREAAETFWRKMLFGKRRRKDLSSEEEQRLTSMLANNPPLQREEDLSPQEREEYRAARFMFEYQFYRQLTNFNHHYQRTVVESKPYTVATRKLFFRAESLNLAGSPQQALRIYHTKVKLDAWGDGKAYNPLDAWRLLVLKQNKEFRRDIFIQEMTGEIGLRYLRLWNRYGGRDLKEKLVKAARLLPLVPGLGPEQFRPPIVGGPFDGTVDGEPLVPEQVMNIVLERAGLRRRATRPPSGRIPPGTVPARRAPRGRPPSRPPVPSSR
jgi:hypothetical protein